MSNNQVVNNIKENKNLSNKPAFYEEYHKNTPKTLTIGKHIIMLSQIAHRFNGIANLVEQNKGVSLEDFEIRINGNIPLELVTLLHQCGYFISKMEPDPKNNNVILTIRINNISFRNFMRRI